MKERVVGKGDSKVAYVHRRYEKMNTYEQGLREVHATERAWPGCCQWRLQKRNK